MDGYACWVSLARCFNPHKVVSIIFSWCWFLHSPTTQVQCMPGRTLQEVLEVQLPELKAAPYSVYQFPVRSLLNAQRSCTSVNGNEITIERASDDYGANLCVWPVGNWLYRVNTSHVLYRKWQGQVCSWYVLLTPAISICYVRDMLVDTMRLLCVVYHVFNPDTSDERLAVGKTIQKSEDIYLSNVQLLLENYCEPLRWVPNSRLPCVHIWYMCLVGCPGTACTVCVRQLHWNTVCT